MFRTLAYATVLVSTISLSAMAEDVKTKIYPGMWPTEVMNEITPQMRHSASLPLSQQEANAYLHKPVYSSDGKLVGELASFQRNADNQVTGIAAEVARMGGLGSRLVELPASQFILHGDRVLINMSAAVASELPQAQR